jgi:hypothetical protein
MTISQYWVGQIPLRNLSISVKDSAGRPLNCTNYTDVSVKMLGSDNDEIDLSGATLNRAGAATGRFVLEWPRDRSLFEKTGDYVLQLVLANGSAKDMTTVHTMRVSELGRLNK